MKQETIAKLQAHDIGESKLESSMNHGVLDIRLYGVIEENGPNNSMAFKDLLKDHEEDLVLSINSVGGEIKEGFAIYEMVRDYQGKTVIKVEGIAASMASMIAMAGDEVIMGPSSLMMIHNPICSMTGNAKEFREQAERLDKQAEAARKAYLLKSGDRLSEDKLTKMLDAETFLTANECLEIGFCDVISGTDERMIAKLEADNKKLQERIKELETKLQANKPEPEPSNDEVGWFF